MTNHNLNDKGDNKTSSSGAATTESFEKVAKDAGLNPEQALDYRGVDQGRNVEPKLESTAKPKDAKKKGNKVKGKKGTKGNDNDSTNPKGKGFNKRTIREEARCSFCGNLMTQSANMNYHELTGYKIPKKADG